MPNEAAEPTPGDHGAEPSAETQVTAAPTATDPVTNAPDTRAAHLKALSAFFTQAGVSQVIWIDDEFATPGENHAPDEYYVALSEEDRKALPQLPVTPPETPVEISLQQFAAAWKGMTAAERSALYKELEPRAVSRGASLSVPRQVAKALSTIENCSLVSLSLQQWKEQQHELLKTQFNGKGTLLLVDQDFQKEGGSAEEGIRILESLQAEIKKETCLARCALLTHTAEISQEHSLWDTFATDRGLERSCFMLISKSRLVDDQFGGFVLMLRLTILNSYCEGLRIEAGRVYEQALQTAKEVVSKITIYDMEQIVFASSRREGVWEPDTLFRILGMYLRRGARQLAFTNTTLRTLADTVRNLSGEKSLEPSPKQEKTKALELRRIELYEEADYLNTHFTPIDLGDIFEVVLSSDTTKQYILLSQPCDMMVRFDDPAGERKRGVTDGILLEIVSESDVRKENIAEKIARLYHKLEYYMKSEHAYVEFAKGRTVNLAILDLCVFNANGQAELAAKLDSAPGLIPSWQLRKKMLQKELSKATEKWQEMVEACKPLTSKKDVILSSVQRDAIKKLFGQNLWIPCTLSGKGSSGKATFPCSRIRRLNQPWAGELLTAYSHYLSRAAFEHDYGSIGFDASSTSSASTGTETVSTQ